MLFLHCRTCACGVFEFSITFGPGRPPELGSLAFGELRLISLGVGEWAQVEIKPAKQVDGGGGKGASITKRVEGGVVGLLLDGRGRPLQIPQDAPTRMATLKQWNQAVGMYPIKEGEE